MMNSLFSVHVLYGHILLVTIVLSTRIHQILWIIKHKLLLLFKNFIQTREKDHRGVISIHRMNACFITDSAMDWRHTAIENHNLLSISSSLTNFKCSHSESRPNVFTGGTTVNRIQIMGFTTTFLWVLAHIMSKEIGWHVKLQRI